MSFIFHLPCDAAAHERAPAMEIILAGVHPDALRIAEASEVDLDGAWPERFLHFYVHGRSARSVEVERRPNGYDVRIMTCSNRVDHELALDLVWRLANVLDVQVYPEDSEVGLTLPQFEEKYGTEWIDTQLTWGPRTIIEMAEKDYDILDLYGAVRPYFLGREHMARLRARGPSETLSQRLLEDIQRVQFLEDQGLFAASVMQVREHPKDAGYTLAVIGPGVDYLLPNVERFSILTGDETLLEIPVALLETLMPGRPEKVDELQMILRSPTGDEWDAFVARARPHAIPRGRAKPWWKFW